MFAAPADIAAEAWSSVPDALRITDRPSEWSRIRHNDPYRNDSFLEGPSFDRDGNLYLTDIAHGRIFRVSPKKEWTVAATYDGAPNGLKIHKDGAIYIADYKRGVMRMDPATGTVEPFCVRNGYEPFRGLNDLYFASNGDLYFTDQSLTDLRDPTGRVFRLSADGGRLDCLIDNVPSPNGLVMTPEEDALLLAVTRANAIWRLPLRHDGGVGLVGLFIQLSGSAGGGPDGLAVDEAGNLAVAHVRMGSVWVFSPLGEPLYRVRSCRGMGTTNIAFGGPGRKSLFITESQTGTVLRAELPVPGQPMYGQM